MIRIRQQTLLPNAMAPNNKRAKAPFASKMEKLTYDRHAQAVA